MEMSNVRKGILFGVAGLATAAIGASTVNGMVSEADQPEAQQTGQPPQAQSPVPAPTAPAPQLQVQPAPAPSQAKPQSAPAAKEAPAKPAVKPRVKPAVKPAVKTKVKTVAVRKPVQPKVKSIVKQPVIVPAAVLTPATTKPVAKDLTLATALAGVREATEAVKKTGAEHTEAKKKLRHAKSELENVRKRIAEKKKPKAVTTATGVKVSKNLANRVSHHRSVHVKAQPGKTVKKISVSSSNSSGTASSSSSASGSGKISVSAGSTG